MSKEKNTNNGGGINIFFIIIGLLLALSGILVGWDGIDGLINGGM